MHPLEGGFEAWLALGLPIEPIARQGEVRSELRLTNTSSGEHES